MRFAADVQVLTVSGHPVLWHGRTGRHLALTDATFAEIERWTPGLAPPPDLRGLARRLDELHLLAETPQPDLGRLIPARSRLALLLPDVPALWIPVPHVHPAGGHPWHALPLTPGQLAFWRACNGSRTVADAAALANLPPPELRAFLSVLTHPSVQAVQLRDKPVIRRDASLERLVCPARLPNLRPADPYGPGGETRLAEYHLQAITDGSTHFDDRETTVAHAFALPHPALGGQRYGERLYDVMEGAGLVPDDGLVVEIGPGTGELGAAWLERAGRPVDYLRLDQSPELLRTQRARLPGTQEKLASATALPLADRSAALVICNEVIADLAAVPYDPDEAPVGVAAEVEARLRRYRIEPLPGRARYNLGAWQLVEELARVLAPGGAAFVSEFGGPDEVPQETEQLDHPEVSIHFGHLLQVARALGLRARLEPLADWMGFDLRAAWLSRHSYQALRARYRAEGRILQARAWTPESLVLPWPVEGLHWVPVSDEGPGPLVTRFWTLLVQR